MNIGIGIGVGYAQQVTSEEPQPPLVGYIIDLTLETNQLDFIINLTEDSQ